MKNCKNCMRHLRTVPICILPDGTQSEATCVDRELDCEYHLNIVEYLKLNERKGIYLTPEHITLLLDLISNLNDAIN